MNFGIDNREILVGKDPYGQKAKMTKSGGQLGTGGSGQPKKINVEGLIGGDSEDVKIKQVGTLVGKSLQKARQAAGLSQKQLATALNIKPNVIAEYESGKGVHDEKILSRLETKLNVRLRGKDIGQSLRKEK